MTNPDAPGAARLWLFYAQAQGDPGHMHVLFKMITKIALSAELDRDFRCIRAGLVADQMGAHRQQLLARDQPAHRRTTMDRLPIGQRNSAGSRLRHRAAGHLQQVRIADKARSKYPLIPTSWGMGKVSNGTSFYINHAGTRDIGQFDATDPLQRSHAECVSRRQALQMVLAMREFGGEHLKDIELIGTGTQIGIRETRRITGPYVLTEQDAINGNKFEDVIAWRSGYLDIGFVRFSKMKVHDVPYRSIIPVKVDGLLMAGRCISATHVAASAGKSMGNCVATGHAAGLAAAISASKGIVPRQVSVSRLQDQLRKDGVDLERGGEVQENVSAAG